MLPIDIIWFKERGTPATIDAIVDSEGRLVQVVTHSDYVACYTIGEDTCFLGHAALEPIQ